MLSSVLNRVFWQGWVKNAEKTALWGIQKAQSKLITHLHYVALSSFHLLVFAVHPFSCRQTWGRKKKQLFTHHNISHLYLPYNQTQTQSNPPPHSPNLVLIKTCSSMLSRYSRLLWSHPSHLTMCPLRRNLWSCVVPLVEMPRDAQALYSALRCID